MMNYKIVWFDDEFNTSLESIKMQFDDFQIDYVGFESAEEGIKYVKANYHLLDAIVIDGNFFRNKDDNAIDETGRALNMVVDVLKEIKFKKDIPYFILSGQYNFTERKNPLVDFLDIKVYDKVKEEDTNELCEAIIESAKTAPRRNLMLKYQDVFSICAKDKLGEDCVEEVLNLAITLEESNLLGISGSLFLPIRKLLEKLFVKLAEINIIDPDLVNEKGWINGTSRFLSNKHNSYETETDVHPLIRDSIYRLLKIVQDSSHAEGDLEIKVDEYCNQFRSSYLYKSSIYLFFEILTYFDKYIDEHQDLDSNGTMWKKKYSVDRYKVKQYDDQEFIQGTVIRIAENGYGTFLPDNGTKDLTIIPPKVLELKLFVGQKIKVKTKQVEGKTQIRDDGFILL